MFLLILFKTILYTELDKFIISVEEHSELGTCIL